MKKIITLLGCMIICIAFTNCSVVSQVVTGIATEYIEYVDNNNEDPIGLYDQAIAWSQGNIGKGLITTEVGLSVLDEFSKKDLSVARSIIRGTRNSYLSDSNMGNDDLGDVVGTLFYGAAQTVDFYEWKDFQKQKVAFEAEMAEAYNPTSPHYDPYFEFRYVVDEEKRKIYKVPTEDVIKAIREYEESMRMVRNDNQLIEYGIISEHEFLTLFSTEELKAQNADLYRKYCFELSKRRLHMHYNAAENKTAHPITKDQLQETSSSANSSSSPIVNTVLDVEQIDTTHCDVAEQIKAIVVDHYAFDSYKLSAEQKVILDKLASLLKSDNSIQITIVGHTCHIGTDKANANVGLKRAYQAQKYLAANGVAENRIQIKSAGATTPHINKKDIESRLMNRRITFEVNGL